MTTAAIFAIQAVTPAATAVVMAVTTAVTAAVTAAVSLGKVRFNMALLDIQNRFFLVVMPVAIPPVMLSVTGPVTITVIPVATPAATAAVTPAVSLCLSSNKLCFLFPTNSTLISSFSLL